MIYAAILVYCTMDLKKCQVVAHQVLHRTEESCLEGLGIGYGLYEKQGYAIPLYKCVVIKEDVKNG